MFILLVNCKSWCQVGVYTHVTGKINYYHSKDTE